ncbi:hypothetical protein Vi05172_g4673 [Venturia inaequalis]|nr:hypothetical protein Vi05172_g4673 [Venturia inaequalis]
MARTVEMQQRAIDESQNGELPGMVGATALEAQSSSGREAQE